MEGSLRRTYNKLYRIMNVELFIGKLWSLLPILLPGILSCCAWIENNEEIEHEGNLPTAMKLLTTYIFVLSHILTTGFRDAIDTYNPCKCHGFNMLLVCVCATLETHGFNHLKVILLFAYMYSIILFFFIILFNNSNMTEQIFLWHSFDFGSRTIYSISYTDCDYECAEMLFLLYFTSLYQIMS